MKRRQRVWPVVVVLTVISWTLAGCTPTHGKLAPFVPTPQGVVETMLKLAEVGPGDVVYDLGSGDGRIVITAARMFGAKGVGFEIDEALIQGAQDSARRAGVSHLVEFRNEDLMTVDLSPATVVTLYLVQDANLRLRPRLLSQLRPGARVVSHDYTMEDWAPSRVERVRELGTLHDDHTIYLWRIGAGSPRP
ncbi:MAG: methyltransferase domain-containing protein [Candidatus Rokubacteria bacterium]|nr:methyltransferase domain-containing protein [Candidatus Rokubacteria bacterium]